MITKNMVFVLGAGASHTFGYPTGAGLVASIASPLMNAERQSDLWQALSNHYSVPDKIKFSDDELREFGIRLHFSQQGSIDAFLERCVDHEKIGKLAIVEVLTRIHEAAPYEMFRKPDWYGYLWRQLQSKTSAPLDLLKNGLRIITFNYDLSLERYLLLAIEYTYEVSRKDAAEIVADLPIQHVYGSLGHISDWAASDQFGKPFTTQQKARLADSIKVIRDGVPESFAKPIDWLQKAEIICFLGFGFDETNLRRLGFFQQTAVSRRKDFPGLNRVVASGFGLTQAETNFINGMVGHTMSVEFCHPNIKCLDALRETGVLFEQVS